jgi:hypothetical protein
MDLQILQVIGSFAALITAVGIIMLAVKRVYVFARRIENAIGANEDGLTISKRLQKVEHQVFPNGGGSLSDQITDLNNTVNKLIGNIETVETLVIGYTSNGLANNNKRTSRSPSEVVKSTTVKKPTTTKK